jgi:SRSO17 transposase
VRNARRVGCWRKKPGWRDPCRIQSLLGRSSWSADALSARVRSYALDEIGDPDGVLVVDDELDQRLIQGIIRPANGFLKKGAQSAGGARQYSGTAGRIENCRIGVFATYARRWGHALIGRVLEVVEI